MSVQTGGQIEQPREEPKRTRRGALPGLGQPKSEPDAPRTNDEAGSRQSPAQYDEESEKDAYPAQYEF